MSKFPLQSLVKQRWLALTHVHPCDTYFSMSFLSYSEISALFFFQTESFYFIYGTKIKANAQTNSTTDRADSVKISCWKVPLIFFSSIGGNLMVKVCHVITVKKISEFHQLFSKYGNEMTFIQGLPYPYTTNKFFLTTHIKSNVWFKYTKITQT